MGNNAKVSGYGEIANANGFFNEQGDAQRSQLLFRGNTSDDSGNMLSLNGVEVSTNVYDFSKNYADRYVSFSGKATIMGSCHERTYTADATGGSGPLFYLAESNSIGAAETFELVISGTGEGDLDGTYELNYSDFTPGTTIVSFDVGGSAQVGDVDSTLSTMEVKIIEHSTVQVTENFIGWYNGFTPDTSYIYAERNQLANAEYLTSGMFNELHGTYNFADDITTQLFDGNKLLYIKVKGFDYTNCKWLANVDMLTISEDPS